MKKVMFLLVLIACFGANELFSQQFLPANVRVMVTNSADFVPAGLSVLGQVVITGSSTNPVSDLVCELEVLQGSLPSISGVLVVDGGLTIGCAELFYGPTWFSNNLQIGSVGLDVYNLQRFMNTDTATMLGDSGPGSMGFETMIFDENLKNSVVLYQLVNGIPSTGFLGPITRAHINARLSEEFGYTLNSLNVSNRVLMVFSNLNIVAPKILAIMIDSGSTISNLTFRIVDTSCPSTCPNIQGLSFVRGEKSVGLSVTIRGVVWIGRNCYVESSDNLRDWSVLECVLPTTRNFEHTLNTGSNQQFFRLRQ
jgi:hypothetical protein